MHRYGSGAIWELPFPPGQNRLLAVHAAARRARAGHFPGVRLTACWTPAPSTRVWVPGKPGCPGHSVSWGQSPSLPERAAAEGGRAEGSPLPAALVRREAGPQQWEGGWLCHPRAWGSAGWPGSVGPMAGQGRAVRSRRPALLWRRWDRDRQPQGGGRQLCQQPHWCTQAAPHLSAPGGHASTVPFCWLPVLPCPVRVLLGSLYTLFLPYFT